MLSTLPKVIQRAETQFRCSLSNLIKYEAEFSFKKEKAWLIYTGV